MNDASCSTLIWEVLFLVSFIREICHTMFVCILTATCMFCNGVCMWRRSYVTHTQWCVLWDTLRILCWLCGTRSTVFTSTQHCIQVNSWLFLDSAYKSVVIIAEYVHPSIQKNCCLWNMRNIQTKCYPILLCQFIAMYKAEIWQPCSKKSLKNKGTAW